MSLDMWTHGNVVGHHVAVGRARIIALMVATVAAACGDTAPEGVCVVFAADGSCEEYAIGPTEPVDDRPGYLPKDATVETVCDGYREFIVGRSPAPFTPDVTNPCAPGTVPESGYAEGLAAANYVRWLAGLRPLEMDTNLNAHTQLAAAIMSNAGQLSHTPDSSWACYTAAGARGAAESNLGLASLADMRSMGERVAGFFRDAGENNLERVGHRRWLLSAGPRRVGLGYHESRATGFASIAYNVLGGQKMATESRPHVAYPEGIFPIQLVTSRSYLIPWSVSFEASSSFLATTVSVTMTRLDDNVDVPIQGAWINRDPIGDDHAVIFIPEEPPSVGRYRFVIDIQGEDLLTLETELVDCS